MWSRRLMSIGLLCEYAKGLQLECPVRRFWVFGSKSRQVFGNHGRRPLFQYSSRNEEGVGMGGEAGSDSGAQSKVLADHSDLTRWNEEMMNVLVAYLSAQSCAARCLRKVNRRKKLRDQARQERKRCQLSSDVRVHSRRRQSLVVNPVIGFRCARRATTTASPISIDLIGIPSPLTRPRALPGEGFLLKRELAAGLAASKCFRRTAAASGSTSCLAHACVNSPVTLSF
jgi:hypothetical protein